MSPLRRHSLSLLTAVALAAALAWGFWPRPPTVDAVQARVAPLEVTVEEEGRTRVIDRFVISPPVAGYLRRIGLKVGDAVAKGDLLAELEPLRSGVLDPRSRAEAEARLAAARAAVKAAEEGAQGARAESDVARVEYGRRKNLCTSACISREEVDRAEAEARRTAAALRSAQFQVEVARFELAAAATALEHSAAAESGAPREMVTLRAPLAGRVLKLHRESEGVVEAGQPLLELGDPRALEVAVDLLSADAVRVRPGTRVRFARWGGEGALAGVVRRVEPVGFTKVSALGVEEQRVWVIADLVDPPERWQRLGDGYRVEAELVLWRGEAVLQVPASAPFRAGEGWALFVVEAGRVRRRAVTLGHRSGLWVELLAGAAAGEWVVSHPDDSVAEGRAVTIRP